MHAARFHWSGLTGKVLGHRREGSGAGMASTLNYGIIGCGMMGREHILNIRLLPDARVAVICEPDAEMRRQAAALAPEAAFADSPESLLAEPSLDAVVIASPNFTHVDLLETVARTRPLPVLVEKPLYTSHGDRRRLDRLPPGFAARVWVAMEYRYMPPLAAMLAEADSVTGGIRMLTIREHRYPFLRKVGDWNRFNAYTGGTLVEKCCHFFDLMRLAIRSDPVRVMASAGQDVNHLDESYAGRTPDIWDNGYVIVDFANGARAMLELCMFAEGGDYQEEVTAVGAKGKIEALVPAPAAHCETGGDGVPIPKVVASPRSPRGPVARDVPVDPVLLEAGDHNGGTYYQHRLFLESVRNGTPPEVTLADGAMAVGMGHAAQESALLGRTVMFRETVG